MWHTNEIRNMEINAGNEKDESMLTIHFKKVIFSCGVFICLSSLVLAENSIEPFLMPAAEIICDSAPTTAPIAGDLEVSERFDVETKAMKMFFCQPACDITEKNRVDTRKSMPVEL